MRSTSAHTFSQVFLHLNWHCRNDAPMITPALKQPLHGHLEDYCRKVKGVRYHGSDGTATHVHLVIQIEPFVTISEFVGKVKGASAHAMNEQFGAGTLNWQRGYGLVSFAKRDLSAVLRYVECQEEHHQRGAVRDILERGGDEREEEQEEQIEKPR